MANALPTRSPPSDRPSAASIAPLLPSPKNAVPPRPPRSLSRPPPKINLKIGSVLQSTPRKRGSGLALQARDSVAVRKRTISSSALAARVVRHNTRKANAELLQPTRKPGTPSSTSSLPRNRSPSPVRSPGAPQASRSSSPSPSSPSQSHKSTLPSHPPLSGSPSAYRQNDRTHIPHDSQGTTTSAYPPSSFMSTRSSSPDRSRTPSPPPLPKTPSVHNAPITTSLDLDPDDVNARLRLLVNNSYFLPPAHAKPELTPIQSTGATSPNAFKGFFRRKTERKNSEPSGYASEGATRHDPRGRLLRVPADTSPRPMMRHSSDGRVPPYDDGYFDLPSPQELARNRVVVVRETVPELPSPLSRAPFRPHEYNSMDTVYNDPTTQYDVPPPTHFPSYAELRIDSAGISGNVQIDQFVPPGEPWSPAPSSPNGSGMDPQERVWRRAILEQAVDLSLSSGSDAGVPEAVSFTQSGIMISEESIPRGVDIIEVITPITPKSPKNKRSWWGRKEKADGDTVGRTSTSSSPDGDPHRNSLARSSSSHDTDERSQSSLRLKRSMLGQRILPNVHAELEEFEREKVLREKAKNPGLPPPLRPSGKMSAPRPHASPSSSVLGMSTVLSPPPKRKVEDRRAASSDDVTNNLIFGHSTIRKSLSSPLLSDLHETGVDVERHVPPFRSRENPRDSNDSLAGMTAPSFVLHDPSGQSSLVHSYIAESLSSGSHYDDTEFDNVMAPPEFPDDDSGSVERWQAVDSSPVNGRPSLDSFGVERVRSEEFHPRASSTFGFSRSPGAIPPSRLWEPSRNLEVDISGDPTEHLSMLERGSPTSSMDSHHSSVIGYASALDYTITRSPMLTRAPSPSNASMHSNATEIVTNNSTSEHNDRGLEAEAPIAFFDSIQHESYMDEDDDSEDSDDEPLQQDLSLTASSEQPMDQPVATSSALPADTIVATAHGRPADNTFSVFSEHPSQPLTRKSLNLARPSPAFATQFRNASQPHLPANRAPPLPPIDTTFRTYEMFDRRLPLTNTPLSAPSTLSGNLLSQFKGKRNKSPATSTSHLLGLSKKPSAASLVVVTEPMFESIGYPPGTATSTVVSESQFDSVEAGGLYGINAAGSQRSLLSLPNSETGSLQRAESVKKLDGLMMQHLEAERHRLRKIASAAKERSATNV